MDIDFLGSVLNEDEYIKSVIVDIINIDTEPDGLIFNPDSIQLQHITEDAMYTGIRVRFKGNLGTAIVNIQIDIGFQCVQCDF